MPDATITSTASTFGSISGTFAADQSTIAGTITAITGTIDGSVGVPGPQGPVGPTGATGPQGDPGAPGVGVPADGLEGQILAKASDTSYDTVWIDNSAVTLNATVRNESGSTMAAGTVVYITGASGNKAVVSKASASSEATSSKTFAILAESIPNNQNGTSVTVGLLKDINTSGLTEGGSLWLSTTAGQWTQTMPTAPNHAVFLGTVTRVHATQGEVEVRIQNGLELQELHNVKITSVANGQVLKYDSAQGLWVNGTDSSGVAWGAITGTLSSQTDLQTALDAKLPKAGGYITGDIQSSNNSAYRSWDGTYSTSVLKSDYLQLVNSGPGGNALTIEWNGITFPSGKQTVHYPGTSILSGYATESWVTSNFYPLTGNPSGFLTSASLSGYATESWVTSQGYITSAALAPYLTSATAASTYQTLAGMSSYLTTSAAASTYYLQTNPAGYITSSALSGYATQAWVDAQGYLQAGALTGYALESWVTAGFYPLTGNPSGFITSSALTGYATESWVTTQGYLTDAPSDGNQYARKNGAWDVVSAGSSYITSVSSPLTVTSGDLSIDLSPYETISNAAATYYPLSNPTGFISIGALAGYATETFVTTQGYVDSAYVTSALSGYATLASPIFTGDPRAPTPATADNDTSIATTAFVKAQGYLTSAPVTSVAGKTGAVTLVVGDVSGAAPLASPTLTGTPLSTTAAADTNTTQIATTAYVVGQASSTTPAATGTAAVGTSLKYARADHVHANPLPTGGTTGQVLSKVDGTNYNVTWTTSSSGGGTDFQSFTTAGTTTWTKPANAKVVHVRMFGGGGGGGSGANYATTSARAGGGGGAAGSFVDFIIPASVLGATESVVVGAGGTGGAAQATATSNGNPGTSGGASTFYLFRAGGGLFGNAGTTTAASGGANSQGVVLGYAAATASGSGGGGTLSGGGIAGSVSSTTFISPTGGGGGAGAAASSFAAAAGGAGGSKSLSSTNTSGLISAIAGGSAGQTTGTVPTVGVTGGFQTAGTGGGGGAYRSSVAGMAGAAGAFPGGGGGGGSAADNLTSGAGANGAGGAVYITTYS